MVNDNISPIELYIILMTFISDVVYIIRENEYSNQTSDANDIKKDATQCENFS